MKPLVVVITAPLGASAVFVNGGLVIAEAPGGYSLPVRAIGHNIAAALGVECFSFAPGPAEPGMKRDDTWLGHYQQALAEIERLAAGKAA